MIESLEKRQLMAAVPAGFVDSVVSNVLSTATAIEVAKDGRIFVAEQTGGLRVFRGGQLVSTPAMTLNVDSTGERGFIGMALSPDFDRDGYVYVYYTTASNSHNRLSRFTMIGDKIEGRSERVLLELPGAASPYHNGGGVEIGSDGKLYLAVGDHNVAGAPQSLQSPFGKILRLNTDGSIPSDNPFYNQATGISRAIWALGLRNPFSIAFSDAGRLYINDVGQDAAEEINIGVAGGNYGWPVAEGNDNSDPRYRDPIYNYSHDDGCAIVGAAVYEPGVDNFPPGYVGKYFFADLCDGEIRYLNPDTNRVSPFATGVTGPTALTVSPTGELYYLQSRGENGSTLRKISYSTTVNVTLKLNTSVPGLTLNIDDQFVTGPAYVNATAGSVRTLSAPPTQVLNGITYNFVSWSDNGAATHNVRVPGNPITYLAKYEREGPGASLSPLPPTAVRVDTVTGRRQLNFFWNDRADNESGYKVERSRNGGAFTLIAQVGADANRYFDLPPAAGEYTYRVRGFNAYGHSAYSAEISATVA